MSEHFVDIRLLKYAMASVEHGSFRRAAAALNVDHSAISRGVRSLEHRLGARLFERVHTGIRLTSTGKLFFEEASLGFDHLRRAMQKVGAAQRSELGDLTVGVSLPIALFSDLFGQFKRDYAGVTVEIVEDNSAGHRVAVQRRRMDVAFVTDTSDHEGVRSLHLCGERTVAILPKFHPLAGSDHLMLEDIRLDRFILCAEGSGPDMEKHLIRRMAKLGVVPNLHLHRVGLYNLIDMVAAGFGVTIAAGMSPYVAMDGVVLVPLSRSHDISVQAIWMDSNPNPALQALLDIVRRSIC